MRQNVRRGEMLNRMAQEQNAVAARAQDDNQVMNLANMRQNGYKSKLVAKVNHLLNNDRQVKEFINKLNEMNKGRQEMKDQLRKFKENNPLNYYADLGLDKVKEDIARDSKIFKQREVQAQNLSRMFFERFTSNQSDWTEDH